MRAWKSYFHQKALSFQKEGCHQQKGSAICMITMFFWSKKPQAAFLKIELSFKCNGSLRGCLHQNRDWIKTGKNDSCTVFIWKKSSVTIFSRIMLKIWFLKVAYANVNNIQKLAGNDNKFINLNFLLKWLFHINGKTC